MQFFNFNRLLLARPFPDIKTLIFKKPLYSDFIRDKLFFDLGREALIFGLVNQNIKPGDSILLPAYMCESTVTPLRLAGYNLIFFDIEENLKYDPVKLKELSLRHKVKAVLIVHYFGFPSNINEISHLCKSLRIKLIEDLSHSFFSAMEVSGERTTGDIVIYSMRKNLPIRDGGVLKLKYSTENKFTTIDSVKPKFYFADYIYIFSRFVEYFIYLLNWPNLYSTKIDKLKNFLRTSFTLKKTKPNYVVAKSKPPSIQLLKYLSDKNYIDNARTRISQNYRRIVNSALDLGFTPQFINLPNNCVPQWVILKDQSGHLVKKLRKKGIGACNWPGDELVPEVEAKVSEYPNSRRLNSELALIPTHQSIGEKDCDFIIATLSSLTPNEMLEE